MGNIPKWILEDLDFLQRSRSPSKFKTKFAFVISSGQFHIQSSQQKHEKVWNMFKVNNKDTRTTPTANGVVPVSLLLILNIFHTLF